MTYDDVIKHSPYSLNHSEKEKLLTDRLLQLTEHHRLNCSEYAAILNTTDYSEDKIQTYTDLPYLPVRLFKDLSLKSIKEDDVVKTMTSSGTTGQKVSKIYLDKNTSSNQQKTMVKIVNDFTGSSRMPMIIIDCPSVLKDRAKFSARGAGILGFSIFGANKIYALDDDMKLNIDALNEFLNKHKDQTIFMFGFTFMIWQYFYKELIRLKNDGIVFDFSNAILMHGGGWKKLANEAVSPDEFRSSFKNVCGLERIHDYYGMVEQTGCIYMQCECGNLHASVYSDVIARRPNDFSICEFGEPGILQVVSTIPESYPGHSLLTEDEGVILGEDDCPCGRKGKYFKINGRIAKAEIRGCSDTFEAKQIPTENQQVNSQHIEALKNVNFLVGNKESMINVKNARVIGPFDDNVISFLNDLSKELMSGKNSRIFPDIISLGYWLRKSSVCSLKNRFAEDACRVGRGIAFHIAPSNVPVNFAYSLFTGLMCGNINIVRVPSKDFHQVNIINNAITAVLSQDEHKWLAPYITLVKYEANKNTNDYFSSICDIRIIWGGDNTIKELRRSEIPPRSKEITFADRYSLAVIDSNSYLKASDKKLIASNFYNDTYLSDQNACTSPRVVVWTGDKVTEAKTVFWNELHKLAKLNYDFQSIQGVDKLSQLYIAAVEYGDICKERTDDNILYRVNVSKLKPTLMKYRGNSGYFYEYECENIKEIFDFCNDTHCQTIGYFGNKEMICPLLDAGAKGIDRVVPIGRTMNFDLVWDGYNLVNELTRNVNFS